MTQQNQDNPSDQASVKKDARKRRKKLEELERRMERKLMVLEDKIGGNEFLSIFSVVVTLCFIVFVAIGALAFPVLQRRLEAEDNDILTAIVGSWKMVSSTGMDHYIQMWKSANWVGAFDEKVFRFGVHHFEFDNATQTMTTFESVGTKTGGTEQFTLGKPYRHLLTYYRTTYLEGHQLVTIAERRGEGAYYRRELFVKDGKLHIVTKRWGLTCTRIYKKMDNAEVERFKEHFEKREKTVSEQIVIWIDKGVNFFFGVILVLLKALCDD